MPAAHLAVVIKKRSRRTAETLLKIQGLLLPLFPLLLPPESDFRLLPYLALGLLPVLRLLFSPL